MLEIVQLEFLVRVLCLGPRPDLRVIQANADRTLAAGLMDIESRFGSPKAREMALQIIAIPIAFDPPLQSVSAAQQVLEAEVNMMAKAYPRKDTDGGDVCDRGPLTRHRIMEADTSQ